MRKHSLFVSVVFFLPAVAAAQAKETIIAAGSLLQCTLEEPDFSSASAQVGDPVDLPRPWRRGVRPGGVPTGRVSGRASVREQGSGPFWGKGRLKLEFDRISLPDTTLPVPGIVAVRGYRVDREGEIMGHGHHGRDAIEWLIPPLWPWKLVSLPSRGPRPTLKGETEVTLRLMDDVEVPLAAAASRPAAAQSVPRATRRLDRRRSGLQ